MEEPRVFEWPLWARLLGTAWLTLNFVLECFAGRWPAGVFHLLVVVIFWRKKYPGSKVGACQTPQHYTQKSWRWVRDGS